MTTGEKIKKIRTDNNLSQDEFAKKLDVTRVAVSKWELGKSYPSIANLKNMCTLFNISFDDLLEETNQEELMGNEDGTEPQADDEKKSKLSTRKKIDIIAFSIIGLVAAVAISLITSGLVLTFNKTTSAPDNDVILSPIESIYVSEKPTYMTYLVGQSFNSDGLVVMAVREDNNEEAIEGWTIDVPETFDAETKNGAYTISYTDKDSEKTFTTTLDGVNVYSSMRGVFSPNGLIAIKGPIPQKAGTKFNSSDLLFHVTYDVNGETIEDTQYTYRMGDQTSNNSYDVIKLAKDTTLTDSDTTVSIYYSQGKSAEIKIDVFESMSVNYKKSSFDASKDKFNFSDVELLGEKSDGSKVSVDPNVYTWVDNIEDELSDGQALIYNGDHTIVPSSGNIFNLSFKFKVTNGVNMGDVDPNLNEDFYFSEAENLDFVGNVGTLVQTGEDYTKDFKATNITLEKFRAAAYLGYTGRYEASGKGFVLGFDVATPERSMSFTFNAPGGGFGDLIVRGSTNVEDTSNKYRSKDLIVTQAAKIYLNNVEVTSQLDQTAVFEGVKNSEPDEQNRTGTVEGYELEGRYKFVNWTEVNLGKLNLKRGKNTIKFVPNNNYRSGQWDTVKVDITPYKDGGSSSDEISLSKTESTLNVGESETLICYKSKTGTVNWTSSDSTVASVDQDGKVTAISSGNATITATFNGKSVSCTYEIIDPDEKPDLNDDTYTFECEDMTLTGKSSYLKQTGDDYTTDYVDSNCSWPAFHAAAYLGYTGDYAASGRGFVHNFDDASSTMSQTFTLPSGGDCDLTIRVSSNYGVEGSTYKTNALRANKIAKYTLNGVDITSMFTDDMVTKNITSDTPDAQNRTGTVTYSLDGRYRFVYWTDITIKGVRMKKGENTIVITSNNGSQSGHWDCVSLNFKPYKSN